MFFLLTYMSHIWMIVINFDWMSSLSDRLYRRIFPRWTTESTKGRRWPHSEKWPGTEAAESLTGINPLVQEFKIPTEPINAGDKWRCPDKNQCWCALRFIVLSYSRNSYSKDFLMYDRDPGGLLIVLVLCRCVNAMEAKIETARLVKEDGHEFDACGVQTWR